MNHGKIEKLLNFSIVTYWKKLGGINLMNGKISILIPTKNRISDVVRCLNSVSKQEKHTDEVVIVDSGKTDDLRYVLNTFQDLNVKYVYRPEASLTKAENIGVENCLGDIIIILDDDVTLETKFIQEIIRVFDSFPLDKIGGVTGNSISIMPDESNRSNKKYRGTIMQVFLMIFFMTRYGNGKFLPSGMPTMIETAEEITECEFLYGCCMAFRKEVIKEILFDEYLQGYSWGEDDDIAFRISRKYQNYYTPFAGFFHHISPSNRSNDYSKMKMAIENHHYLFKKNMPQDTIHKFAFWWSVVGILISAGLFGMAKKDVSGLRGVMIGLRGIIKKG